MILKSLKNIWNKEKKMDFKPLVLWHIDNSIQILAKEENSNLYYVVPLKDGLFSSKEAKLTTIVTESGIEEDIDKCLNFRAHIIKNKIYITYSKKTARSQENRIALFDEKNNTFKMLFPLKGIHGPVTLVNYNRTGEKINAIHGEVEFFVSESKTMRTWKIGKVSIASPRKEAFDRDNIEIIGSKLTTQGILIIYDNKHLSNKNSYLSIGAVLLSKSDPEHVLWRTDLPIWEGKIDTLPSHLLNIGFITREHDATIYYYLGKEHIIAITIPLPHSRTRHKQVSTRKPELYKHSRNPLITPYGARHWESVATFNPAALYDGENIHLLYRAIGKDDISVLGYAKSKDGLDFDYRHTEPAYIPTHISREKVFAKEKPLASYDSGGGGWGGSEDPRLTLVNDTVYLTYTAFDGWSSIRIALTSISLKDFQDRNWRWKKPVPISPPGEIHKNWVIFPEKINGKYAILHALSPHLLIDYVDDLNSFDGTNFIKSNAKPPSGGRKQYWDNRMRGIGPSPIKTKYGWLIFYHAMDVNDPNKYKLGAMLLDLNDPTKILYRSSKPILEPVEDYENEGLKRGVVYSCGAVVKDEILFVYYGGADTVSCVATAPLNKFLEELRSQSEHGEPVNLKIN